MTHKERRTTSLSPLWLGVAVLLVGLSLLADTTAAHGGEKDSHEHEHQPHGAGLAAQYELEKKLREEKAAKQAASQRKSEQFKMPELSRADKAIFMELFNSKKNVTSRWTFTNNEVYNGKWRIDYPPSPQGLPGDKALIAKLERPPEAERYSAHVLFPQPLVNTPGQDLIIQYDVRFQQDHCAGAYIKLLSANEGPLAEKKPLEMDSSTPFVIMFGPDRCGDDDKVHFIFRNYNQNTKKLEEKHLKNPPGVAGRNDWWTHHYALHINRDNTFDILLDNVKVRSGSLFTEFEPSVNPPKVIPDPDHKKPASWDDRKEIADPLAVPPSNWDEDEMLQVPCSDLGRCGSQNNCFVKRGAWKAPRIPNPKYSGEWVQRTIPNPKFYEDKEPTRFSPIAGLGFELLTSSNHLMIDNILVTHDKELAAEFVKKTWEPKLAAEKAAEQAKAEVQRKLQAERGEKIAKEKAERDTKAKMPKTEEEAMLWKEQALHAKWEQGQFDMESLKDFGEFLVYKYKSWGIVGLRWIENHPYTFVGILATLITLRFLVKAITRKSPKKEEKDGGGSGTPSKKKNKKKKTTKAE